MFTHLLETKLVKLALEIVNCVEDCGVFVEKVAERLGECLGFDIGDLAQPASLVLGNMPVDLADLIGSQFGNT